MKVVVSSLAVLAIGVLLMNSPLAEENKIFPFKINQSTLENGLRVVAVPFDSPGLVAYYTVVRTGSRNEVEPGHSGFAHFFEHMMFRGTERYSTEKYHEVLKVMGADSNAFTTDDWTCYHAVFSSSELEKMIELEADRFMNLKYNEEGFKTEAGAVLGEYNKNYSNPMAAMYERLRDEAFVAHTYKHTTMGFLADIKDMPNQYAYSLKFFSRYYRPENCIIVVVGDFDQAKLLQWVKNYYGRWTRGDYQVEIPQEPPQTAEKLVRMAWKNRTLPYLMIGYHVPEFDERTQTMPALDILSQMVFSQSAPLFQKLVLQKQMVEFIGGSAQDRRDPALFIVSTRIKSAQDIDAVRSEIDAAMEEAKSKPVDAGRLAEIKSNMRYSLAMRMNNPDSVANTLGHFLELTGNPDSINRVYAMYDRVTAEDLMAVAKKYFTRENRTVVILTEEQK
ncbi:MAG: insulinase family protein [Acidobacteria bacterium]|nr:insulinase family protein [Acidobacteriota bacterium]MBI3658439.1 insulinase family protein [Acidobacteriota bacterium]